MRKIFAFVTGLLIVAGGGLFVAYVEPPFRVALHEGGGGCRDTVVLTGTRAVIRLDPRGGISLAPLWEQPHLDLLVADDLEFRSGRYHAGDRLTTDGAGNLVRQGRGRALLNDLRYHAWKLKQKREPRQPDRFVRAERVKLRESPDEAVAGCGEVSFAERLRTLDTRGDWVKVQATTAAARGWLHASVTGSREQVDRQRQEGRIPHLVLLVNGADDGAWVMTLAGGIAVREETLEQGKREAALAAGDTLLFTRQGLARLARPIQLMGHTIPEPVAERLYYLNPSGRFEPLDPER